MTKNNLRSGCLVSLTCKHLFGLQKNAQQPHLINCWKYSPVNLELTATGTEQPPSRVLKNALSAIALNRVSLMKNIVKVRLVLKCVNKNRSYEY